MRVLLWGEQFWPCIGGAELFAADLIVALRRRGYGFTVVTSQSPPALPATDAYLDTPVHRFPFRAGLDPRRIDRLIELRRGVDRTVRASGAAAILLNGVAPSAFFCVGAAVTARVPLLVRANQEVGARSARTDGKTLIHHVLERAAWVVGVSHSILAQWVRLAPATAPRSSVIYNGVAAGAEPPPAPPPGPPRLLCLGRLVEKKGFDLALEAFASLHRSRPDARLTIVGDGPEREALHAQTRRLGLEAWVDLRGWLPPHEVPALIAGATLVIIPSRIEGLPAVALQAAAAARPVVATARGGIPEAVEDGRTGVLTEPDPAPLAGAIGALLERPETMAQMGRAAWQRVRTMFSPERCADEYDALLQRVAARAPAD